MRTLRSHAPNEWALRLAQRRACGLPLLDLTETNPSRVGLVNPTALEVLARAAAESGLYNPDPRGILVAREAIARRAAEQGSVLDPDDIVLVASTSEAYAHLFRLLADPGDDVLIPRPSYPLVEPIAAAEGLVVRPYDLVPDDEWRVDFASLERAAGPRTRAIVVIQPNNPTGTCLDAKEIGAVDSFAAARGLALISDEVFGEFPRESGVPRLPSCIGERLALTFVLDGISKSCGLPQMKLAWIAASGPPAARADALRGIEWLADLFLSVSTPAQLALPEWLDRRGDFQAACRSRCSANLAHLNALASRRRVISLPPAHGGWSALIRVPATRHDEEWALALLDRGVAVHPGHFYDFVRGNYLIVSLMPEPEVFERGLSALEDLLESDELLSDAGAGSGRARDRRSKP